MAPKRKNMPHNAFFFYMCEFKAKNKCTHSLNMNDLVEAATPTWKELPDKARVKYEAMAAEWKSNEHKSLEHKYTTTGVSYAELERQDREIKEKEQIMNNEIEGTIKNLDHDIALPIKNFFLIHVNFYCHTDIGTFIPCEVAISEFTLQNGVQDFYHTIINIDEVPLGYSYEALKVSEETHQIPVPPHDLGEKSFLAIFNSIKSFLEKSKMDKLLPPLYSQTNTLPVVKSFIKCITSTVGIDEPEDLFRIYPLSKLFFELRNACAKSLVFPVLSVAERELDKDHFSFTQGLSCNFHEDTDARQYCSLSLVKRWAYTIADHCCQDLDIALVPGRHVPLFADTHHYLKLKTYKEQSQSSDDLSEELKKCEISSSTMKSGHKNDIKVAKKHLSISEKSSNIVYKDSIPTEDNPITKGCRRKISSLLPSPSEVEEKEFESYNQLLCSSKLENEDLKPQCETKSMKEGKIKFEPSYSIEVDNEVDSEVDSEVDNEVDKKLKPLRLPKTRGIAMRTAGTQPRLDDFKKSGVDGREPLVVAGRGRGIGAKLSRPHKGRGRRICKED